MSARRPLVAGNWKMHKTGPEAVEWVERMARLLDPVPYAEVAVCPPFTAIEVTARAIGDAPLWVCAQAVHEAPSGAHTGEIGPPLLIAAGASGSLVGHSERRAAGETDEQVARRVRAALDHGLAVILCVGESLEQRRAGVTEAWLSGQVAAALAQVRADEVERLAIAYEPIWAIGTGETATPEIAQDAIAHVRSRAGEVLDAERLRVLYGGSVKPENAAELMAQPDIDGALVGGASLDADGFAQIVRGADPA
jgi:triosephosphate isomerase